MNKCFCTNCGKEIEITNRFCPECGTAVVQIPYVETAPMEEKAPVTVGVSEKKETVEAEETSVEKEALVSEEMPEPETVGFVGRELAAKNTGGKVGKIVLSCLLSILIFIFATSLLVIVDIREGTDDDKVEEIVDGIDLKNVSLFDITGNKSGFVGETEYDFTNMNAYEYASEFVRYYYSGGFEVSPQIVEKFLDQTGLQHRVAETLADCMEDLHEGENDAALTAGDIRDILKRELHVVLEGGKIPEYIEGIEDPEYYEEYKMWIQEEAENYIDSVGLEGEISTAELKRSNSGIYYLVRIGLSYYVVAGLILVILLLGVLLYIVNKRSLVKSFKIFGLVIASAAVIFIVMTLVAIFATKLMASVCGSALIGKIVAEVLVSGIGTAVIVLVVGCALAAVGFALKRIVKKKTTVTDGVRA